MKLRYSNVSMEFPWIGIKPKARSHVVGATHSPLSFGRRCQLLLPLRLLRRSYSCYNCNLSFQIIPTSTISPSAPSSFRCPGCHHRHLIPYYIVSLPLPPINAPFAPSQISNYTPPAPGNFNYELFDESDHDDDDDDSDNSLPSSFTAPDSYPSTPASKSIVSLLRVKIFSPNSTQPLQSCSICMEDFDVDSGSSVIVNELPCDHYFHKDCIVEWIQRSNCCPLCRYKLPVNEYDAVLAREREPTGRRVNTNVAASGSDAMRDEDGSTSMV